MEFLRFNLHGNVVEFCRDTSQWSWSGWVMNDGELFFCNGNIEFKKIVNKNKSGTLESGETIICLIPGEMIKDPRFESVEDAVLYHNINTIGEWKGTQYWVGYSSKYREVSFYNSADGSMVELKQSAGHVGLNSVNEMRKILDVMLPLYETGATYSSGVNVESGIQPQLNGTGRRSAEVIWN